MAVGPESFAGDDVLEAIAVHVDQRQRMQLREGNSVRIGFGTTVEDQVLFKVDLAIQFYLFIPGQAVTMCVEAGNDIVKAVSIDVIDQHLSGGRKGERMFFPDRITG